MNRIILVLTILSAAIQLHAQIIVEGKVMDADTKAGIPYVNIGIAALASGTVSDFEGNFILKVNADTDVVTFSSIGYEELIIKAGDLADKEAIVLTSKYYDIETIEIAGTRFEDGEVMLGVKNEERGHSIGFGSAQLGAEIGAVIEVEKPVYIKDANFVLNHAKGDSLLFRVNIYEFKDGKAGKNLLAENILIEEEQRTGTLTIDMDPYNVVLKSDVLLTLEWLRNYDERGNKDITFDTKKSKSKRGIYVRYSSLGALTKLPYKTRLKPCFYLMGKQIKE